VANFDYDQIIVAHRGPRHDHGKPKTTQAVRGG
jgi:hypothetical protein